MLKNRSNPGNESGKVFVVPLPHILDSRIGSYYFKAVWYAFIPPQEWSNESHAHGQLEISYITEGEGEVEIGGRWKPIKKGSLVLGFPGETHRLRSIPGRTMGLRCIAYGIELSGKLDRALSGRESAYEKLVREFIRGTERVRVESMDGNIGLIFSDIQRALEARTLGWEEVGRVSSRALLLATARLFVPLSAPPPEQQLSGDWAWINWRKKEAWKDSIRDMAMDYMIRNCHRNVSVEEVAKYAGVGVRQLQRTLETWGTLENWGTGFRNILLGSRISIGKFLLISTDKSVTEVAHAVGMGNPSHFTSAFRKYNGMSPRQYRALLGGKGAGKG